MEQQRAMTHWSLIAFFLCCSLGTAISAGEITEPIGGQPALGSTLSVKNLDEQVAYQRAFEAVIWSQPLVGIYGIRKGLVALGLKDNDILAMSRPLTTRHELLTANNNTPYIIANGDLRSGPVVLEIPAAGDKGVLYGQVVDAWQETIADVGPLGEDKGKGGKYLFLPPGWKDPVPDGYIAMQSKNFRIQIGLRSIKLPGMSDEDGTGGLASRLR